MSYLIFAARNDAVLADALKQHRHEMIAVADHLLGNAHHYGDCPICRARLDAMSDVAGDPR